MADDQKEERIAADIRKNEMNVGRRDEGSVEIKEVANSEQFTEDLNRSGSEMNDTVNDLEGTAEVAEEEKPRPVKRGPFSFENFFHDFENFKAIYHFSFFFF